MSEPGSADGHRSRWRARAGWAAAALLLLALAACSGGPRTGRGPAAYAPPGEGADPWGPYVREAAGRFGVPETWVREVMRQESGGHQYLGGRPTTSPAGAMGLMQVMPATYEGLRARYNLGDDPYDPHDNIMAGTAYIREMYDRFGAPGFLAAYNAGPGRMDDHLASGSALPAETVSYVASVGPRIAGPAAGAGRRTVLADAMQPIASPGDPGFAGAAAPALVVARMEPIASPGDPGVPALPVSALPGPSRMEPIASAGDPGIPPVVAAVARAPLGTPLPEVLARLRAAAPPVSARFRGVSPEAPSRLRAELPSRSPPPGFLTLAHAPDRPPAGGYAIQVGAFATAAEASSAAERARLRLGPPEGRSAIGTAAGPGGTVLFRARVLGFTPADASRACGELQASGGACFVVPPDGFS